MDYTSQLIASGLHFGEGPRWHNGELWFSDFFAHQIKVLSTDGTIRVAHEFPDQPSGLGWLPDGTLIAVSMVSRKVLAFRDGQWHTHADLADIATFHANDMVVNSNGNAYVGNFGFDLDAEVHERGIADVLANHVTAKLALVRPDGTVSVVADELHFPNGMVITPDGSTLIVAETASMQLTAFTIAPDGTLSNRRLWAQLQILPDGICLDEAGGVWAAAATFPIAMRIVEGGEVTDQVSTPLASYACMLGGADGKTLYIMNSPDHDAAVCTANANAGISSVSVQHARAGLP